MEFQRDKYFDELILKIKQDNRVLESLDYEELAMLMEYLIDLSKWETKGDIYV